MMIFATDLRWRMQGGCIDILCSRTDRARLSVPLNALWHIAIRAALEVTSGQFASRLGPEILVDRTGLEHWARWQWMKGSPLWTFRQISLSSPVRVTPRYRNCHALESRSQTLQRMREPVVIPAFATPPPARALLGVRCAAVSPSRAAVSPSRACRAAVSPRRGGNGANRGRSRVDRY